MGVAVEVEGLTKSFGSQNIWSDVTLTLPPGEISVLLGPSGTGKSVFLKSLVGLLKPEQRLDRHQRHRHRPHQRAPALRDPEALRRPVPGRRAVRLDEPLRQHRLPAARAHEEERVRGQARSSSRRWTWSACRAPRGSSPARSPAACASAPAWPARWCLDPEIILFDEPDSGLDPVRVAYLNQLIVDLNAQIDATFLIVTHDIGTARTVPDNLGLLFRRNLVMFGPREQLLTSQEPVVRQFLNGRREGPIGMSEEKDVAQVEAEMAALEARGGDAHNGVGPKGASGGDAVPPQLTPTEGLPERKAARRRQERVARMLHEFDADDGRGHPPSLPEDLLAQADAGAFAPTPGAGGRHWAPEADAVAPRSTATVVLPRPGGRRVTATDEPKAPGLLDGKFSPTRPLAASGNLFAFALDTIRALPKRPFQLREFIQQTWFVASVTILPTALVAIPFGAVIALQLGLADPAARRPVLHRVGVGARRPARGQPDRHGAAHRRRRWLGDLRRPRRPQDPRRDRRHGGAGHQPDPAPGRAPGARLDARRGPAQRPGQRRRRRRAATSSTSSCRAGRRVPTWRRSAPWPRSRTSGRGRSRR